MSHPNLSAYDGVEDSKSFKDKSALDLYCEWLLKKSTHQVDFIRRAMKDKKDLRVLEFCSGNSRVLYELHKAKFLKSGTGVEISKSRHTFAEAWRRRLGIDSVKNIHGDVLGAFVLNPVADLAIMLTGSFQYMEPISPQAPGIVLRSLRRSLSVGGTLIMELYPSPRITKHPNTTIQDWSELPIVDPWRFYLNRSWYDDKTKLVSHRKIFISQDGKIDDGRLEVLRIYQPSEIGDLLDANGFTMTGFYGDWHDSKATESSEINVVVGKAV